MDFLIPVILAILILCAAAKLLAWRRGCRFDRLVFEDRWRNPKKKTTGLGVVIEERRPRRERGQSKVFLTIAALLIPMLFTGCGLVTPEQQSRIVDAGINRLLGPVKPVK